jgi:hypothetical protein
MGRTIWKLRERTEKSVQATTAGSNQMQKRKAASETTTK